MMKTMTTKAAKVGDRFGRLVVLGQVAIGPPIVRCQCDCGNTTELYVGSLLPNKKGLSTKSCGCLRKEGSKPIHGLSKAPEYGAWHSLKGRCLNPSDKGYVNYGGRGITVCEEWRNSLNGS